METEIIDGEERGMEIESIEGEEREMETININGEEYVRASDAPQGFRDSEHVIVICTNGWIFEGRMRERYKLADAHNVRKWSNGRNIGGLQRAAYRDEYTLDEMPGGVELNPDAVVAVLPVTEW